MTIKRYDESFKLVVVNDVVNNHLPIKAAVRKYCIDRESVRRWLRQLRPDLFVKRKHNIEIIKSSKKLNEMSPEEMKLELELLRFENEALKKLHALIRQREDKE